MRKTNYRISLVFNFVVWIFILVSVSQNLTGQKKDIIFSHFTVDNGLSQNTVDYILRDSKGFIWIATWNGLNKYNGYKIEKNFESSSLSHSLSSNFVHVLCEDNYGNIWIGTEMGLDVFIYSQNKVVHHNSSHGALCSNQIISLLIDYNGNLMVGTQENGMDILKINEKGEIEKIQHFGMETEPLLPNNTVYNLVKDNNGNIFVCTAFGLVILDSEYKKPVTEVAQRLSKIVLPDYRIFSVLMESPGKYWIGTQTGLVFFDVNKNKQTNYYHIPGNNNTILHSSIKALSADLYGNILIGTLGGLSIYNRQTESFSNYENNPGNQRSLDNNFINCMLSDEDGNVWIGTEKGGVNKYNIFQNSIEYYTFEPGKINGLNENIINSIFEDNKYLWIGTAGGGLNIYDKKKGIFKAYKNSSLPNSISGNFITAIHKDKQQRIWIGTWGAGINYLTINELQSGHFNHLLFSLSDTTSISSWFISSIISDSYGNTWIGSYDGLDKITSDGKLIRSKNNKLRRIGCLLFDKNQNLWVGTENGLFKLQAADNQSIDARNCKITTYMPDNSGNCLPGHYIISLIEDHLGNIWAGTYDNGFSIINLNNSGEPVKFQNFNQKNGLSNNTVYGIVEDERNNMWFSTDNGLSCFDVGNKKFRNFYVSDGLLSNQFYWSAYYKNSEGKLYFGGTRGLQAFHPDSIYGRIEKPKIQLTGLKIYNQEVFAGEVNSPLTKHINELSEIKLKYKQNSFSISFISINYNTPDLFLYSYILEGIDNDWIIPESNYEASYTKLPPGKFIFKVKVWERANPLNYDLKNLIIYITPPFWKTWWFYILVTSLVTFIVLSFYYFRTNELRRNNLLLEVKVKERTKELSERNQAIIDQNEEIYSKNEQITSQKELLEEQQSQMILAYEELDKYRNQLEVLVDERTAELKLAKEKAEESDRLKSSFLANISHEIRTPLNAIIGFLNILFNDDVTNEDRQTYRLIIESSSQTLLDLINDIIDISKIEAGHLELYYNNFKIRQLFDNLHEIYVFLIRKESIKNGKSIDFIIDVDDEILSLSLLSDETRVKQVFTILINNAIKFTNEGFIKVGGVLKRETNTIQFYVTDTGIGISNESQKNIFDRFRKVEDNNAQLYRGTGIGLSIAKSLVTLLGGNIRVESETGKGSTFLFTLPLDSSTKGDSLEDKESPPELPDLSGKNVLIAEDDLSNYTYIKFLLDKTKATIYHAIDGIQAVKIIEDNKIDLILLDIKMPRMDGYEVLDKVKSFNLKIPVIAQTAYALNNDIKRIKEAGFSEYLTKPIKRKDLFILLNHYTKKNS